MSQKSKTEGVCTSLVLSEHASTVKRLVSVCVCVLVWVGGLVSGYIYSTDTLRFAVVHMVMRCSLSFARKWIGCWCACACVCVFGLNAQLCRGVDHVCLLSGSNVSVSHAGLSVSSKALHFPVTAHKFGARQSTDSGPLAPLQPGMDHTLR